jgi:hypothetical protein
MASPPPPYANVTGISRAVMKDSPQETFANYDGNARAGELVVNLDVDPPTLYIGNALGNLNEVTGGNGGSYGNSNVAAYLPNYTGNLSAANITVTGNIIPSANNTYNLGNNTNRFNNLYLTGNTIFLGSAILSSNASAVTFAIPGGGNVVLQGNANTTLGNIVGVNLDGNSGNVLSGAGTWIAAGGGGNASLPLSNGNSQFNIATANGPVTLTSAGQTWTIGTDGTLTAPNNSNIYPAGNNFNVFTPPAGSVQFYSDGGNYSWSLDGFGVMNLPFASAMSNTALVYSPGNLRLDVGANNFMFTDTGTVVFPTLTVDLHNGGNQYAQTLQFGDDTQQAVITGPTPAANVNAQRLIIQGQRGNGTGEGGDVYFWAGDADTNGGDIKIYAGDADNVSAGYGGYINLDGGSGYDGGGQISVTGGYSANGPGGTVNISAGQGGSDGGAVNINGGVTSADQGGNIALTGGYGGNNGGEVRLTGGSAGTGLPSYGNIVLVSGVSTWTFDNTGVLNLPGGTGTIESSANNISIYSDAGQYTGALFYDTGAEIYALQDFAIFTDNANSGHIWRFYANGNMTAPGAINVGNMVIGTVPGDITANNNTTVAFNVTGSGGGFLVNYLKEVGNANTSGGELAFSSETGNATYRISLSDDLGNGFATKIWRFDGNGLLTLPGSNVTIGSVLGGDAILSNNVPFGVISQGNSGATVVQWSDDISNTSLVSAVYVNGPFGNVGDIQIRTGNVSNANVWTFSNDGNLVLPNGNSVIYSTANSSLDPTNPNVSTMTLTPDANYNSQVLVLDPTAPGHIHLRAYASSNIDEPSANIFLGGEYTAFEVTQGANNVARIHSGNLTWTFSNTSIGNVGYGVLELPGESYIRSNQDTVNIQSVDANGIGRGIYIGTGGGLYFWDGNSQSVSIQQDNTNANLTAIGNASITSNVFTWTFGIDGNLTLPGNLISSGASPAPIISGFSSISSLKTVTTPQPLATLTATSGARAFINDSNLVAAGNFGANVSNGGANTVPVWSDGTNWYIG